MKHQDLKPIRRRLLATYRHNVVRGGPREAPKGRAVIQSRPRRRCSLGDENFTGSKKISVPKKTVAHYMHRKNRGEKSLRIACQVFKRLVFWSGSELNIFNGILMWDVVESTRTAKPMNDVQARPGMNFDPKSHH